MEARCEVSLTAISRNYRFFKERMGSGIVIPVVKANAYGHGAVAVTRHLHREEGVRLFAVATLAEAHQLAESLPEISILIFTRVFAEELTDLPKNTICTIVSMEHARSLEQAANQPVQVHLNVNTGMNRLGLRPEEAIELLKDPDSKLNITGLYSHFSSSDTPIDTRYAQQRIQFRDFVSEARGQGWSGLVHFSNSAALLHPEHDCYDAMRLGIGLYGYDTYPGADHQAHLQPAMELKAPLMRVERVQAGETVSYAERWCADRETNIGTLRIGYADGYNRLLTNNAWALSSGKEYPVIGTVTMDHIMLDLGNDEPEPGTYFTVLGGSATRLEIGAVAERLNTIAYEICCAVSRRVPRLHLTD